MIRHPWHKVVTVLSPLDLTTILYMLLTGIYLCFGPACLAMFLPHLTVRLLLLAFIICLCLLNRRFPANKPLLFVRNLYPLLFLGFFYTETNCMKNTIFSSDLDPYFFRAEQMLWHCQPSLEFSRWMSQGWFNELMNLCYFSYYILIGLTCIVLYLKSPLQSAKGIFTVVFSFYLYYFIFALIPVVGPQYYVPDPNPQRVPPYFFGKLMHFIIQDVEKPTGAFPSSHVGIAVVILYVSFQHLKKLFLVLLPFALGICFATVYIKAHYLVDVIAGILSAPLVIVLSRKIYNKFLSYRAHGRQKINTDPLTG